MGLQVESVEDLFAEESLYQAYLDVEVALAKAQASQGIIPVWAATRIEEAARIELLDLDRIHDGLDKTGHPLVPIIWELDRVCGEEAGGYIHWGATTQNITQTGKLLLVKRCHGVFLSEMGKLLKVFAQLAEDTKSFAMPGRTHGQHAVPATFGYKVAVWIDEILRHVERLKACEKRVFVVMLGGGGGADSRGSSMRPGVEYAAIGIYSDSEYACVIPNKTPRELPLARFARRIPFH